ncbi:extracellular matrix glycoprotein pherophorin-S [Volvox carteri f. nagariensis]|uniref:Extracellular matrix glycoprotein pherophorin-S n=1 Tax=Volvox carteri f. nagariensis TaxID=3068 RepID=D8TTQ2_VOLCA|nr:extracellular matrix glycoprotein pherophorin-S [Volvox carteri f. nagariensis]EFJ49349.1 extracellular matrix glycoprotein pherophorin-S [Volvox carteri f. nagariensis]|eukprot:XP_002949797.1 extracellular matrix glycoprotein pherophorin-S [Volvox carteri f. nagariensis]
MARLFCGSRNWGWTRRAPRMRRCASSLRTTGLARAAPPWSSSALRRQATRRASVQQLFSTLRASAARFLKPQLFLFRYRTPHHHLSRHHLRHRHRHHRRHHRLRLRHRHLHHRRHHRLRLRHRLHRRLHRRLHLHHRHRRRHRRHRRHRRPLPHRAKLQPPAIDVRPYRYDPYACFQIQDAISTQINVALIDNNIHMLSYFVLNYNYCTELETRVCGTFAYAAEAQNFKATAEALMPYFLGSASVGSVCKPELEGYRVEITTEGSTCLDLSGSTSCNAAATPVPSSTCNMAKGTLPFLVSTRYMVNSWSANSTEYCFQVNVLDASQVVPGGCSGDLSQLGEVQLYARRNLSASVHAVRIYPSVGSSSIVTPSWTAIGGAYLFNVPLHWSISQAQDASVCIELDNTKTMLDLCLGFPGQCYVSTVNTNRDCCPSYRTALGLLALTALTFNTGVAPRLTCK